MKSPKGYLTWQDVFGHIFTGSGGSSPPANKELLGTLLQDLENLDLQEDDYTPESWQPFFNTWEQAKLVYADEEATQEQVDSSVQSLTSAYNALVEESKGNEPFESSECGLVFAPNDPLLGAFGLTPPEFVNDVTVRWPEGSSDPLHAVSVADLQDFQITWPETELRIIEVELLGSTPQTSSGLFSLSLIVGADSTPTMYTLIAYMATMSVGNWVIDVWGSVDFPAGGDDGTGGVRQLYSGSRRNDSQVVVLGVQGNGEVWLGDGGFGLSRMSDSWDGYTPYEIYPELNRVLEGKTINRIALFVGDPLSADYIRSIKVQSNIKDMSFNILKSVDIDYVNSKGVEVIRSFCGDGGVLVGG